MAIGGGALWQPMAVLMMSGLAVASVLTLFFVPAGYFLLFRYDKPDYSLDAQSGAGPFNELK